MRYYDILIMPGNGDVSIGDSIHDYCKNNVEGYVGGVCVPHKVKKGTTIHYMLQTTEKFTKRNGLWESFSNNLKDFVRNIVDLDVKVLPIIGPEKYYNTIKEYSNDMIMHGDMKIPL